METFHQAVETFHRGVRTFGQTAETFSQAAKTFTLAVEIFSPVAETFSQAAENVLRQNCSKTGSSRCLCRCRQAAACRDALLQVSGKSVSYVSGRGT